jgi:hypothetical protein
MDAQLADVVASPQAAKERGEVFRHQYIRAFDVAADGTLLFTARTSVYAMRMTTPGTRIPRAA